MRRLVRACGSLCLLGAVVWGGAWVVGRGSFAEGVDGTVEAMRAAGYRVEIADRRVAGWPLGFNAHLDSVRIEDPASGVVALLPRLETRISVTEPDRIVTVLPDRFTAEIPVSPDLAARFPGLPARLALDIAAEGAEIATIAGPDGRGRLHLTARRLVATPAEPAAAWDLRLEAEAVDAAATGAEAGGPAMLELAAGAWSGRLRHTGEGFGAEVTWQAGALSVDAEADPATGAVSGTLAGEGAAIGLVQSGARGAGRLSVAADRLSGAIAVDGHDARAEASLDGLAADLRPADTSRIEAGRVTAASARLAAESPVRESEGMRPFSLDLAVERLAPDDALWQALDPEGALPREPVAIRLVAGGSARVVAPLDSRRPGAAPPVEIGNLSIGRAEIAGLGAAAEATGDVEFRPLTQQPQGAVRLRLDGALGLIRALSAAGLIAETTVQTLATMAAFYTRPGDAPDVLLVDLGFGETGITVNGDALR